MRGTPSGRPSGCPRPEPRTGLLPSEEEVGSSNGTEAEPRARLTKNVSLKVQGKYDGFKEVNHLRNLPLISGRITCCTRTNIKSGYPEPRPSCWPRNRAVSYPTSRWWCGWKTCSCLRRAEQDQLQAILRIKFEKEGSETKPRGLTCKEHDDGLTDELNAQIADNHAVLGQEPGAGQHSVEQVCQCWLSEARYGVSEPFSATESVKVNSSCGMSCAQTDIPRGYMNAGCRHWS